MKAGVRGGVICKIDTVFLLTYLRSLEILTNNRLALHDDARYKGQEWSADGRMKFGGQQFCIRWHSISSYQHPDSDGKSTSTLR